jgi:TLC domain
MLYELSTPFLNFHWFFDKLNMTGSKAQLYNGIALVSVFFSCRLVWGAYSSFNIYRDTWNALYFDPSTTILDTNEELMRFGQDHALPIWLVIIYMGGHVTLQCLNVFWLGKMVAAIRKRFTPGGKANATKANGDGDAVNKATTTGVKVNEGVKVNGGFKVNGGVKGRGVAKKHSSYAIPI